MSTDDPFYGVDMLTLVVERADVEANRTDEIMKSLTTLLRRDWCQRFRQRVNLGVNGYDDDPRELYEVPEFRRFMITLDALWPYWAFFLWPGHGTTLPLVLFTLTGATSAGVGLAKFDPISMARILTVKLDVMRQLCVRLGDSEPTIVKMRNAVHSAFPGLTS